MGRIILIENRPERMNLFLRSNGEQTLSKYDFIDVKSGDLFNEVNTVLQTGIIDAYFQPYTVIISHRSAFTEEILVLLKKYCELNKKMLVLFSGGYSESFFQDTTYPFLALNSKLFYSSHLVLFLDAFSKGNVEPRMLQYGNDWKMNVLLGVRDRLNQLLISKDKRDRTYLAKRNDLRREWESSAHLFEMDIPQQDWSEEVILELKKNLSEKISEAFAFGL